ncbi:hypothetical protein BDR26DRAFT_56396 [Obelidium mucronatum]|nr:hypothetical protein BDR26DRAFT_56396 [Obelidium mucronatum]
MRTSLYGDPEASLKPRRSIVAGETRTMSTLQDLESSATPLEIPTRTSISSQPKAMELHEMLLGEQKKLMNRRNTQLLIVDQVQAEIRRKNRILAAEEFSYLLHNSRNTHLGVTNIMLLEHVEDIVKEKKWVSDLKEKERIGKLVAELEVKESHNVLECQKLAMERQAKEKDLDNMKKRRETALKLVSDLLTLQKQLEEFQISSYNPLQDAFPSAINP